jgi:hypothetical protein
MTVSKRTLSVAIAVVVIFAMVGAGIALLTRGGNATASSNTPTQTGGAGAGPNSAAFQKFRQCLKNNGVTPRQPGTQGSGPRNDPAFGQAMQACRQYAPQRPGGGGFGPPGSRQNPAQSQQPTATAPAA